MDDDESLGQQPLSDRRRRRLIRDHEREGLMQRGGHAEHKCKAQTSGLPSAARLVHHRGSGTCTRAQAVYLLCMITTALCAGRLVRSYRRGRTRILLWSSLCFAGLALTNALLFLDLVLFPTAIDLALPRALITLASLSLLVFGLVWDAG
ncbi:MAG TPA: DUF5985 family protein [Polyangiales bacterium]|nr:DUF5985 family protein [Polyangiales bacterium]